MAHFFSAPFSLLPRLTVTSAIDILVVAVLIYQFLHIIQGRRAVFVLLGICILGVIYGGAIFLRLELLRTILALLAPFTPIALIVMFQAELRRMLARLGRHAEAADEFRRAATLTRNAPERAALEKRDWNAAMRELIEAVKIDGKRFAPFPVGKYHPQRILVQLLSIGGHS